MHHWSMQKVALDHLFRPSPENLELGIGLLQALSFVALLFFQELKDIQACLPPKPEHRISLLRASCEKQMQTHLETHSLPASMRMETTQGRQ